MREFGPKEIVTFLRSVDKHAKELWTLVVIGGAAASLRYGAKGGT